MTEYRKRFIRDPEPAGFLLTPRDVTTVLHTWDHRWLTRHQLQRLLSMPCVTRINHLLRRLWDHGFLHRLKAITVGGGMQPVYVVGPAGVGLVVAHNGLPSSEIRSRIREDARAGAVLLPHDLEVNDLRIALTHAIERQTGTPLDCWLTADRCYDVPSRTEVVRPDGYFRILSHDVLSSFFLELDRGSTTLTRWSQKVARYIQYRESGNYARRYGLERFRVLVMAPSERRLQELRAATAEFTDRSFWFGLTSDLISDADPYREVWRPVASDGFRSLIERGGSA